MSYSLFLSLLLNAILRQRNLLNKYERENFIRYFISAMTTWENRPINRMEIGLLKNRTIHFLSSELILHICKHAQVLVCFPHPAHWGCFASFTQKRANQQEEKHSGNIVWDSSEKEKLCKGAGSILPSMQPAFCPQLSGKTSKASLLPFQMVTDQF